MLQAFFDETGTNPNTDIALVLGGFLGQAEQWQSISQSWNECLQSDPAILHFSHRNCRSEKKLLHLAAVIARSPLMGFCVYIRHKSISARDANSMKGVAGTRPYDWVFRAAIETVLEHVETFHPTEKVDFTFDNRNELKVCIPYFYERKKDATMSCYRHAGKCEPGDDKISPALQMADFLAGEFNGCKKQGRLSEPLRLILKANGVIQGTCAPPEATNRLIALNRRSKQIEREGIALFQEIKKIETDRLPLDLAVRFHEFRQKSVFHDEQLAQHNGRFKNDPTYIHGQSNGSSQKRGNERSNNSKPGDKPDK